TLMARTRQRPEALIFANDNLACGAILAAQRSGLSLPQDLAIFGFGDSAFADQLRPSLSTLRPPAREMGRAAVDIVTALQAGAEDVAR
ncbi:substrate-binding domain-containing protein, partial [Acinetobacter baumannii]